jgi:flagellar hook-length control protein FliK
VRIAMHPADLGHLQAVVTLRGNDLQVSLTPQTQQGRDVLTNAVHTLKEELSRGGVNVNVTLHDPGFQSRGEDRPPNPAARGEILPHEETTLQPLPSPVPSANQIDLRL